MTTVFGRTSAIQSRRESGQVRVAFRPDIIPTITGEAESREIRASRKRKTPTQYAIEELARQLDNYNLDENSKVAFLSEAKNFDTVAEMNMAVLAAAFVFLSRHPDITTEDFTNDNLAPFLDQQLMQNFINPPKEQKAPSKKEIDQMRIRYKQTLLRYILKIQINRGDQEEPEAEISDEPLLSPE